MLPKFIVGNHFTIYVCQVMLYTLNLVLYVHYLDKPGKRKKEVDTDS